MGFLGVGAFWGGQGVFGTSRYSKYLGTRRGTVASGHWGLLGMLGAVWGRQRAVRGVGASGVYWG